RRTFPGKVLVISEFGAEGNARNARFAPGGLGFQARLLRTHLDVYARRTGLAGALAWTLRDFGVTPAFAGGSIHRMVPGIRLVPTVTQPSSGRAARRTPPPRARASDWAPKQTPSTGTPAAAAAASVARSSACHGTSSSSAARSEPRVTTRSKPAGSVGRSPRS